MCNITCTYIYIKPQLRTFLSLLLEREQGREEGRERNIDVREKHRLVASLMRPDWGLAVRLGIEPATQICALPGNRTCNLQPTEPHRPGHHLHVFDPFNQIMNISSVPEETPPFHSSISKVVGTIPTVDNTPNLLSFSPQIQNPVLRGQNT